MIIENLTDQTITVSVDGGEDYIIKPDDFMAVYCENDSTISVEVYDEQNVEVRHEESDISEER